MPYQGWNHTHEPRRSSHGLTPSGHYRCLDNEGGLCGIEHKTGRTAARHCAELNARDAASQWAFVPTWLIPQYSTTDLKIRGWSTSLIRKLLGPSDRSVMGPDQEDGETARNLYDCYRVHDAEIRPDFHRSVRKRIENGKIFKKLQDDTEGVEAARQETVTVAGPPSSTELEYLGREHALQGMTRWTAMKLRDDPDHPSRQAHTWARELAAQQEEEIPEIILLWQAGYLHDECVSPEGARPGSAAGAIRSAKVYEAIAEEYPELRKLCQELAEEVRQEATARIERTERVRERNKNQPETLYNLTNVTWA